MSPYAFYQFWLNGPMPRCPACCGSSRSGPREEIEELERQTRGARLRRAASAALAEDVTTLVHGAQEIAQRIAASRALFGQGDLRRCRNGRSPTRWTRWAW